MPNRILTPREMYLCDEAAICSLDKLFPGEGSRHLMENAALAVCERVMALATVGMREPYRVLILCGSGNNGGDGYAAASILAAKGFCPEIRVMGETAHMSPECRYRYEAAVADGIPMYRDELWRETDYHCIIDALLGIGLSKSVEGEMAAVIDAVNDYAYPFDGTSACIPVIAVDIPSGVDALSGEIRGTAIRATETVTISHCKRGMLLYPGTTYCGTIRKARIGIDDAVLSSHPECMPVYSPDPAEDDLMQLLPARAPDGNKGTFGRAVIFAGSKNMCGAAYLSALAAYRTGAGLVEIVSPEENRIPLQTLLPEAVMTTYDGMPDLNLVCSCLARADAVVLGPGLGGAAAARALTEAVIGNTTVPTVIDADALNLLSGDRMLCALLERRAKENLFVLTPHPGEFSRLTGMAIAQLKADFVACAASFALERGVILCAKDARTVITDGRTAYINTAGTAAMAKGGSGDVLTGLLAALFAQNRNTAKPLSAPALAALGVWVHGLAGEAAAARVGSYGVLAREIADAIPSVLRRE